MKTNSILYDTDKTKHDIFSVQLYDGRRNKALSHFRIFSLPKPHVLADAYNVYGNVKICQCTRIYYTYVYMYIGYAVHVLYM